MRIIPAKKRSRARRRHAVSLHQPRGARTTAASGEIDHDEQPISTRYNRASVRRGCHDVREPAFLASKEEGEVDAWLRLVAAGKGQNGLAELKRKA